MKAKEQLLDEFGHLHASRVEAGRLIEAVQQDTQPKWVTGAEAREWTDETLMLVQRGIEPPFVWRKTSESYFSDSARFLRLDILLAQEWPKEKGPHEGA